MEWIDLQFGDFANHVGIHKWNNLDELRSRGDGADYDRINHNKFFFHSDS